MRVLVYDEGVEVAHETVVLEAMRTGYRSLPLRDKKGTRIDLCALLLLVDVGETERPLEHAMSHSDDDGLAEESSSCCEDDHGKMRAVRHRHGRSASCIAEARDSAAREQRERPPTARRLPRARASQGESEASESQSGSLRAPEMREGEESDGQASLRC